MSSIPPFDTQTLEAPFARYEGKVLPEWIDMNGHMNLAYYTVLFDYATDLLFETIGIGRQYKDETGYGTFVVETHNRYERELLVGERVRVKTLILGTDEKRIHLAHEMFRRGGGARAATQELLFLSIDLSRRRVVPFRPDAWARLTAASAGHFALPRPDWTGRHIALPARA
jgi:acyl-CoA thioester hydrolase